jgi:hypothetical protein
MALPRLGEGNEEGIRLRQANVVSLAGGDGIVKSKHLVQPTPCTCTPIKVPPARGYSPSLVNASEDNTFPEITG